MNQVINIIIIIMALIGALYALGLIIAFIAIGSDRELYDNDHLYCDCDWCNK